MIYQITFSRNHHYWGIQSGMILKGTLTECEQHKRLLDSLFPYWQFEIINEEKND